jgi:isopentenyldiphosphate isomerase
MISYKDSDEEILKLLIAERRELLKIEQLAGKKRVFDLYWKNKMVGFEDKPLKEREKLVAQHIRQRDNDYEIGD